MEKSASQSSARQTLGIRNKMQRGLGIYRSWNYEQIDTGLVVLPHPRPTTQSCHSPCYP